MARVPRTLPLLVFVVAACAPDAPAPDFIRIEAPGLDLARPSDAPSAATWRISAGPTGP